VQRRVPCTPPQAQAVGMFPWPACTKNNPKTRCKGIPSCILTPVDHGPLSQGSLSSLAVDLLETLGIERELCTRNNITHLRSSNSHTIFRSARKTIELVLSFRVLPPGDQKVGVQLYSLSLMNIVHLSRPTGHGNSLCEGPSMLILPVAICPMP
jgi:hypothetical protein